MNTENNNSKCKIWAIGGGKGGVGKSLVTANTSICLALMGYKVVTIDLDLGGANIHTCLGLPIPQKTLSDYITKKVDTIEELIVPTPIKNLSVISGAQDELAIANMKQAHKSKILSKLGRLDADFVLLDLGAGTTANTLDFFLTADKGILVMLPEPTSIENTYRFIKSVYHRKLTSLQEVYEIEYLVNEAMNSKMGKNATTPTALIEKISQMDPKVGSLIKTQMENLNFQIIINQVRSQSDIDIGFSIKSVTKRYFGIDMDYAGYLDYDPSVWQSVKKRKPLLMEFPNSKLVTNFEKIVTKLLS
ncbi:MAG: P-loop NTPase [Bacteriovoracaceae bacterium]|jgi:flagellar biosynthesis protein FlhG|nr:P-loop NTPase [Bacteriovoracaceae bacterium]